MYDAWTRSWWPRHEIGSVAVGDALVVGLTTYAVTQISRRRIVLHRQAAA